MTAGVGCHLYANKEGIYPSDPRDGARDYYQEASRSGLGYSGFGGCARFKSWAVGRPACDDPRGSEAYFGGDPGKTGKKCYQPGYWWENTGSSQTLIDESEGEASFQDYRKGCEEKVF